VGPGVPLSDLSSDLQWARIEPLLPGRLPRRPADSRCWNRRKPALAYWLSRNGHRPTVVEHARQLRSGGSAIVVKGPAIPVADRMGILPQLRGLATRNRSLTLLDPGGRRILQLPLTSDKAPTVDEPLPRPLRSRPSGLPARTPRSRRSAWCSPKTRPSKTDAPGSWTNSPNSTDTRPGPGPGQETTAGQAGPPRLMPQQTHGPPHREGSPAQGTQAGRLRGDPVGGFPPGRRGVAPGSTASPVTPSASAKRTCCSGPPVAAREGACGWWCPDAACVWESGRYTAAGLCSCAGRVMLSLPFARRSHGG
jgi:hypothetical protein